MSHHPFGRVNARLSSAAIEIPVSPPGTSKKRITRWISYVVASLLCLMFLGWSDLANATCVTPRSLSVASGGSVVADISDCSTFGIDAVLVEPQHGSLDVPPTGNGTNETTYTNNGDGVLSDTFTITSDENDPVVFNVTIAAPSGLVVTPASLPTPVIGASYNQTLSTTGGTAPYVYSVPAGSLPAGMSLSSAGVLSGTPTASGPFTATITVQDSTTPTALTKTKAYNLSIANAILVISPATPPPATINQPYSLQLSTSGGVAPYTYNTQGAVPLPAGLVLSTNGVVSGTPTALVSGSAGAVQVVTTDSSSGGGPVPTVQTLNFTVGVAQPPTVSSVTPNSGAMGGGTSVTIAGTNFTAATAVKFGATNAASFTVNSATSITATAPAGSAGTVDVTVTTSGGTSATGSGDQYTYVAAPTVSSVSPGFGAVAGGTSVTITGNNFSATTAVKFGATNATAYTVNSATQITATAPAESAGTVDVTVMTVGGTSATGAGDHFTYVAAPTVSAVSPTSGPVTGGTSVTITGTNFTGATAVKIGANNAINVTIVNATTITASTPAGSAGTVDITVTSAGGTSATGGSDHFTYAPTIAVTPAALPNPAVGSAYSQTLSASGGTAPYSFAISSGALPAGLTLSAGGTLSGTPIAGGTFNFTVSTTDSSSGSGPYTGARPYSFTVAAPTITLTPTVLPNLTVGSAYSQVVSASGGTAPYSYTVTAGALPSGLTLASNGTVSGTPTTAGPFNFTVTANDSSSSGSYSGARAYSVTVSPGLPVTGAVSATVAYSSSANPITLNLSGGAATSVAVASAAAHGTATASGTSISYTPTAGYAGSDSFIYTATNGAGTSNQATVSVTVSAPTLTITPSGTWSAGVGSTYSQTLTWAGGASPYSAYSAVGLPAGLSATASTANSLTISGTPTAAGSFSVVASAIDSSTGTGPFTKSQTFTLTVGAATINLTPAGPTLSPTYGSSFSQTFSGSGGVAPYTYVLTGSLPTGLSWNAATATLSGTPTQSGNFPISVTATDHSTGTGAPFGKTVSYTLAISAPTITLTPTSTPGGAIGQAYATTISASGGIAPYAYAISTGSLPTGLSLNTASGAISGTPTAAGTFNFTVRASDANSFTATQTYSIGVGGPTLTLTPATIPAAAAASLYNVTFSAGGGTAPYSYSLVAGVLPSGISLNTATGVLSGTTVQAGNFSITVRATDSTTGTGAPFSVQSAYTLVVSAPIIALTPATVPVGTVAASYSATISAGGGVAPYAYSITSGALPAGLSLNGATGALSGTPTAAGSFNFSVKATDANSFTGTQAYTVSIAAATVVLNPATLPGVTAETAYSSTLTASGGTAPYTFAITSGSLPSGISLNTATGVLSGTTMAAGTFTVTIRATDSSSGTGAPFSASRNYTLAVAAPAISLTPGSVASGTVATSYSASISASGGVAPYTYSISAGTLPAGVSLNASTGLLSGTPTAAGTFNVTIKAVDANSFSGTQAYSLVIGSATLTLTPATLANLTAEAAYSATLVAGGGTAPYTFAISGGTLPSGLTLNAATGVLSGTSNQSVNFSVTISVTDSSTGAGAPFSVSHTYALNVGAPTITLTPGTLAAAKANVAFSQQFGASGGIAPYAYTISAGALPAGLTLNAATGVLSGTPSVAGSFAFTVLATDAHNFTGQQSETLAVGQAQPVAVNDSASTQANQPVTVNVTANDSGPITSVAISTPPSHGSATVSGLNVVYTPASNYFGSDSFHYIATGPGGSSAPAAVALNVTPLAVPVVIAQSATILAGQPVTIHTVSGASGGPFTVAAVASSPSVGTAVVSGTDIVYSSVIGSSGAVSFNFTLANAFGVSAPATATINVNPMPVTGTHSATVAAGAVVNVNLMDGATGGPFTAATLISVSPASAGSAVIRDVGSAGKPSYQMSFTSSSKFAGVAAISFTLSNAFATSAPGNVAITVTARPDMSTDPEVTGLLAAQADSARRFASAQSSNFTRRLESLHGDGWGHSSFGVSFAPTPTPTANGQQPAAAMQWQNDQADALVGSPLQQNMRKVGWSPQANPAQDANTNALVSSTRLAAADTQTQRVINSLPEMPMQQDSEKQALSLWIGGAVDFGQQYVNGRQAGFSFTTNGVSIGGDYRINDLATFGLGAGFSRDSSDIGNNGTKSTAESGVAAMYGSLRPAKNVFIDGVLGYGTLDFDSTRYITGDGGFATGTRHGDQLFGTIVTGMEFHNDGWMWSPYGRLELMSATLDQYSENATGLNALTYFKQTVRSTSGTLGIRTEGQYVTSIGTWTPRARIEFAHQFQGAEDAGLAYADLAAAGPAYQVRINDQNIGNWSAGLGARLALHNGVMFMVDYISNINVGNGRSQSVMFGVEVPLP